MQTLFFRDLSSNNIFLFPSQMAASSSAEGNSKSQARKNTRKPKKGKKKLVSTPLVSDPWEQHTPWNWTSLTDPSSSRIPPVFTRDGKYVSSIFTLICCIDHRILATSFL